MNKQAVDLGFVLKQIPGFDFMMGTFDGRLRLQKTIYLLQAFDVHLGYDFSWYLRGPYCSILAANAFALEKRYGDIPNMDVKFNNPRAQERFERFKEFVRGKSTDELEIAASLHYLKRNASSDGEVKERVAKKRESFTREQVDGIWEEMGKCGLF